MAGGGKLLGEGVVEKGKGVGARRVGEGGWGNGGGEGGGERGWGEALIEFLNKTGIVSFSLVIGMHITRRNRPKSRFSRESPILGGNPPVMTSRSRKYVIISPEKSPKTRCAGDFT